MQDDRVLPLRGRVALVTGASRGLGRAIAVELARRGARLVLLARTIRDLEAADDAVRRAGAPPALLIPQDLYELDRLDALGPQLAATAGRLDCVVLAAASLGDLGPLGHQDPLQWHRVLTINLTANQRFVRSVLPLLRRAPAPTLVAVTDGHARAKPFWGAYAVAKAGLEQWAATLQAERDPAKLRVVTVDPGPMATGLRRQAYPGEDASRLPPPEAAAARLMAALWPDTD